MISTMRYMISLAGIMSLASGIELDLNQEGSVDSALATLAYDMMQSYDGNQTGHTPGILPGPCATLDCYYWWVSGAMWGSLINYQQYTGDLSYQSTLLEGIAFQIGPDANFNPPNQSNNIGADDQTFWAFAAMEALEAGLPDLDDGTTPPWLDLADAVFNFQVSLWGNSDCSDGGIRWQFYSFNAGYNIVNSISNGNFFQLAARLARYTGNETYVSWAEKAYDWLESSPLLETQDSHLYIWDSTDANDGCSTAQHYVWSYTYGSLLMGSAMMYNHTNGSDVWQQRITNLLDGMEYLVFTAGSDGTILTEMMCESSLNCNSDQTTFKALSARWLAVTSLLAPFTRQNIASKLEESAVAAAAQCTGGENGRMCGQQWFSGEWDGTQGVGQQMSALAVIGATRINDTNAPLTDSIKRVGSSSGTGTSGSGTGAATSNGTATNGTSPAESSTNIGAGIRVSLVGIVASALTAGLALSNAL